MNRIILTFLINFGFCHSANILGIFHVPFYSHQILPHKIFRELSLRGHNLTIFTTHKMNLDGLSNITQHIFTESVEIYQKYPNMMQYKRENMNDFIFYGLHQSRGHYEATKNQIQHREIQKLIESDQKFDLILMECYFCPLLTLSEIFDCPIALISSAEASAPLHKIFGNDVSPSMYSEAFLPYLHNHLSLVEKIHSWLIFVWMEKVFKHFVFKVNEHLRFKYLKSEFESNFKRVSLLLVNTNHIFGYARAIMPNTKQIGFAHVDPPKALDDDEDLKTFMDSSDVAIVCFGSTAKTSDMGREKIEIFLKTFEKFPELNFVWKFDEKIENLPKNVKIFKWIKLADALAHKNVKLFISHAGLSSAYESIDREVPMIVFPLCFDHFLNAKMLEFNEIAIELDLNSFTENELKLAIFQVLNGKFKENVKNLKKIVNDTPKKPIEVAIESIEFAIRNKNFMKVKSDEPYSIIFEVLKVFVGIFVVVKLMKILRV